MNASTNFRLVFVLLFANMCMGRCGVAEPHLFKLALQQAGLSTEESDPVSQLQNVDLRVKRQQESVNNAPKSDKLKQRVLKDQPPECGINGKTITSVKSKKNTTTDGGTTQMDWPWIASLLHSQNLAHFCGGTLLNRNYILTAAHCVKGRAPRDITVRLGELDFLSTNETESKDYGIEEIKIHGDYDAATQRHDIALLKLSSRVNYNNFIRPICLPSGSTTTKTNQTSFVAGWGIIFYGGPYSDILLEVSVPIWDLNNCISSYAQPVFNTNICAAGYKGDEDSCAGDSGGPLIIQEKNGRWINVGVVSWGIGCGNKDEPGVYTNVRSYVDWIQSKMIDAML